MKYSIFFVLFVALLGCEGNIPDDLVLGGYIKQIRNSQTNIYQNLDFNIVYDDDDRVYAINDTVYTYGSNNKVSSSKFTFSQETAGYKYEKDIQKSYKWDVKGRILEIYVERYLEKVISPDGGVLESNPSGYTEAYFSYTGDNSLPDSISLGKGLKAIKVFEHSKGNISQEEQIGEYINFSTSKIKSYTTQRVEYIYDPSIKNHLYPLFTKMGVLPKGLGYVSSLSAPKSILSTNFLYLNSSPGVGGAVTPMGSFSENFSYSIAKNGYPNTIIKNILLSNDGGSSTSQEIIHLYY